MIFEWDDFGANHKISEQTQSHDCRDKLDQLHYANPNFKATLFAIPGEMTMELLRWCKANEGWIELAVHGFYHTTNWECYEMTYEEFGENMQEFGEMLETSFKKIFRAPGWQISTDAMRWLADHDWLIADQGYNDDRRPEMRAYVNYDGNFQLDGQDVEAYHGHTWDVGWNGIYEDYENVVARVKEAEDIKFLSELL